jgi:endonuclease YncB( thermonuclease family)
MILAGAAVVGAAVGFALAMFPTASAEVSYPEGLGACSVTDGDTIRCGEERIRLLGIDAPELPGHCAEYRNCAPGDPFASSRNLSNAMSGSLSIERIDVDRYGRTIALVAGDEGDLSCWQLHGNHARYEADWDDGFRVALTCPKDIF